MKSMNLNLRKHFFLALFFGWIARLISAHYVYGPQALDDFLHFIMPAFRIWLGVEPNLPDIRSPLMIWWYADWFKFGSWLGIESGLSQLRWLYSMLGTLSLVGIYGAYLWVQTFSTRTERFQKLAIWLVALHGLMPFVSTRALGESIATGVILFGFGLSEYARFNKSKLQFYLGLVILGSASLVRPQAGLLFITYGAVLLWQEKELRKQYLSLGLLAGLTLLGIQILLDLLAHRWPLETLYNYFGANKNVGRDFGYEPWYSSALTVLMGLFAPFTLPLFTKAKDLWKEQKPVLIPFLVFILAHSIVPHKEERFMFPMLGLGVVFLAWLWDRSWERKINFWVVIPGVVFVNTIALAIGCFMNSQSGEIEPSAMAQYKSNKLLHLPVKSLVGQGYMYEFFIRPPAEFQPKEEMPTAIEIKTYLANHRDLDGVTISTSDTAILFKMTQVLADLRREGFDCESVQTAQSLIDKLLYTLNPEKNVRRAFTWYSTCLISSH